VFYSSFSYQKWDILTSRNRSVLVADWPLHDLLATFVTGSPNKVMETVKGN